MLNRRSFFKSLVAAAVIGMAEVYAPVMVLRDLVRPSTWIMVSLWWEDDRHLQNGMAVVATEAKKRFEWDGDPAVEWEHSPEMAGYFICVQGTAKRKS